MEVRKFGNGTIPRDGELALLTVEGIGPRAKPMVADFRDHMAVSFKPAGMFVGIDKSGDMRLGRGTPEMRDGVWYLPVDRSPNTRWRDVTLSADDLELRPIG